MFERFTDAARNVVVLAQEEARALGHGHIGTEHLLLGLLAEGNGVAAVVLSEAGVDLDRTREAVRERSGRVTAEPGRSIPFTPLAKKVLETGLREALQLGHNYIGTEHVLLGVVREPEGLAVRLLEEQAPDVDWRRRVLEAVPGTPAPWSGGARVRQRIGRQQNTTPAVAQAWLHARRLADPTPISSGHLLRALAADPDAQAGRALASLGVTPETIEGALAATPTEGTTDESPEEVMARRASIRTEGDRVVIELADRELAALLGAEARAEEGTLNPSLARALEQLRASLAREARRPEEPGGASMEE